MICKEAETSICDNSFIQQPFFNTNCFTKNKQGCASPAGLEFQIKDFYTTNDGCYSFAIKRHLHAARTCLRGIHSLKTTFLKRLIVTYIMLWT